MSTVREETLTRDPQAAEGRNPITAWLRRVPISDPVDRRNAPALQVVLLLLGLSTALMWLYRAVFIPVPWRPGELPAMAMSLANSALALFGVWLIRHDRFQWAIRQTLAVLALGTIYAYSTQGTASQTFEEPLLVAWIVLAGLMIGRKALWLMVGAVMVAFVAGGHFDVRLADGPDAKPMTALMVVATKATIFLIVALVVDRALAALRESLKEASRRGDALAQANHRLEAEMAERERTQEGLIQSRKVEAVGRLASGIAHDLNHILALILGYTSKGRQSVRDAACLHVLDGVEAAARRGVAITGKLLDFSRYESTRVEVFDATAALHDVMPLLRQLFDPTVRILCDAPDAPSYVAFDRARFDLIVLNIAANANQAMPEGGEFHLGLRPCDGEQVEIVLRDTGSGMSGEVKARVFEPFFTTRPPGQGVGLGLSVARSILVAHGGGIEVESAPGEGTTFLVRLPRARADA